MDHHFKNDTHLNYKAELCYEGQKSEEVGKEKLYLFAKIEATRAAQGASSCYFVVTGKDTFTVLYKWLPDPSWL